MGYYLSFTVVCRPPQDEGQQRMHPIDMGAHSPGGLTAASQLQQQPPNCQTPWLYTSLAFLGEGLLLNIPATPPPAPLQPHKHWFGRLGKCHGNGFFQSVWVFWQGEAVLLLELAQAHRLASALSDPRRKGASICQKRNFLHVQ